MVLATAPNSFNLTCPSPLGVVACVPFGGVAGSVLLNLSLLERNREVMVGEEGTNKELNGFKNQATQTRLRVRKEVPDKRLKYVPERRVWWSVLGALGR